MISQGLLCPLPQQTFCTNKIESSRWVNKCLWIAALESHYSSRVQSCISQLSLCTQPVGSNPIRCSHLLFYRIGLFSFEKQHDLFHSAAALSPFFSFCSYVPLEWGSGFVLHVLPEWVIHKDSQLSKEKQWTGEEGDDKSCQPEGKRKAY